jgi:transcriptional regulator with XRE-family HTH domain
MAEKEAMVMLEELRIRTELAALRLTQAELAVESGIAVPRLNGALNRYWKLRHSEAEAVDRALQRLRKRVMQELAA